MAGAAMAFPQGAPPQGGGPAPMQPPQMQAPVAGQPGGALAAAAGAGGAQAAPQGGGLMQVAEEAISTPGGAQQAEGMYAHAMQLVQSGRISTGDIQQLGALAQTAVQDPRLYATVAQVAGRMGLPIPEQPNPQALVVLALVAHRVGQAAAGGDRQPVTGASTQAGQVPSMRNGGYIRHDAPKKGVNAVLHPGEVVVRADVVRDKGLDFFKKMHEPKTAGR